MLVPHHLETGPEEHGLQFLFQSEQLGAVIKQTPFGVQDPNGTWFSETAALAWRPQSPHFRTLPRLMKAGEEGTTYVSAKVKRFSFAALSRLLSHPTGRCGASA